MHIVILKMYFSECNFVRHQLRDVFRKKKRYYVGKIPTWADPLPQYGNFFDKIPFFSEDVPKRKNLKKSRLLMTKPPPQGPKGAKLGSRNF